MQGENNRLEGTKKGSSNQPEDIVIHTVCLHTSRFCCCIQHQRQLCVEFCKCNSCQYYKMKTNNKERVLKWTKIRKEPEYTISFNPMFNALCKKMKQGPFCSSQGMDTIKLCYLWTLLKQPFQRFDLWPNKCLNFGHSKSEGITLIKSLVDTQWTQWSSVSIGPIKDTANAQKIFKLVIDQIICQKFWLTILYSLDDRFYN